MRTTVCPRIQLWLTVFILTAALLICFCACDTDNDIDDTLTPLERLAVGNNNYIENNFNIASITQEIRDDTSQNGQKPYAVVVACSDSRVPVEHIFSAGIGELFVIRTAGNVLDEACLASIEYAVSHLEVSTVLIMGHTSCGAVAAVLHDEAVNGHLSFTIDSIKAAIGTETEPVRCSELNVTYWVSKLTSDTLFNGAEISGAMYDIANGKVTFIQ